MWRWLLAGAIILATPAASRAQQELPPEDFRLIVDVVCWEARGEGLRDQADVARVVLNRMADGKFGRTVREILYAPGQFSGFTPNRRLGECHPDREPWQRASLAVFYEVYFNSEPHTATYFARCDLGRVFGPGFQLVKRNANHCYYRYVGRG